MTDPLPLLWPPEWEEKREIIYTWARTLGMNERQANEYANKEMQRCYTYLAGG